MTQSNINNINGFVAFQNTSESISNKPELDYSQFVNPFYAQTKVEAFTNKKE